MADRHVTSTDGTRIAVFDSGAPAPDSAVLVAVHGYPDNHTVWDGFVAEAAGRHRVVRYDVRGTGESDKPTTRAAYRVEHLVEDLRAVIAAVSPGAPVHVVAHDWGSVQCWPALSDRTLAGHIAGFTSI